MLDRLQAEETRAQLDVLVAAAGRQAKQEQYRQFVAGLDARAAGPNVPRPRAARARSLRQVANTGIKVIRENTVAASPITSSKPGDRPGLKPKVKAKTKSRKEVEVDGG